MTAEVHDVGLYFLQPPQQVSGPHGQAMYDLKGIAVRALPDAFLQVAGFFLQAQVARVNGVGGEVQNFYFVWHDLFSIIRRVVWLVV
jgi:hypothetical protein